ncbi:hypothetical protein NAT51_14985 [Flavobacterium amniphilum]|uniref:hypothetical protein n=1 Tax=Flavobacterium amniphilum TaxID=1834035 RepID=UPI002029DDDE|nr:hypothetical protein [Flavobacterium amniphilum]MCL9806838.1 hypothetical protein [Flavobacterium amniphilum]
MGYKRVCISCRISVNRDIGSDSEREHPCPECGTPMLFLPHRFRPPQKEDKQAWNVVKFLIENGFPFQHVYKEGSDEYHKKPTDNYVPYPKNLRDAEAFVEKYKNQSLNN